MAYPSHPLWSVLDACAGLRFAPLPDIRAERVSAGHAGQVDPRVERWYRADLMVTEGAMPTLYDRVVAHHGPAHRLPAVSHILRALLREPLFLVASGVYLTGRAPDLDSTRLWFPWRSDAAFGTPTVTTARVAVTARDPYAGHPDALVVADEDALDTWIAGRLVQALEPLMHALHAHSRVGRRNLWGWVVDTLYFYMINPARFLDHDVTRAWERADRLGDALARAGAVFRARPRLFPFCEDHPQGTWAVRGTCCFEYKADAEHGYCVTCPLRDDRSRSEYLQEWVRTPSLAP